jgi:VWFA-related protein
MGALTRRISPVNDVLAAALAPLVMLALCSGHAVAQEDTGGPTATFYEPLQVELVDLDVVVTDRSGVPIADLTADDFDVFEDGTPVEVTHFYAAGGTSGPSGDSRLAETIFLVLFVDDTNVDPQLRTSVLSHVRDLFGATLPPNVLFSLVRFDGSLHIESDFSKRADDLFAALDRLSAEPAMNPNSEGQAIVRRMQSFKEFPELERPRLEHFAPGSDEPVYALEPTDTDPAAYTFIAEIDRYAKSRFLGHRASIEALRRFSAILGAMPGRTVMLWVGGLEQRTGEMLFRTWQDLFPEAARRRGLNPMAQSMQYDLTREIDEALKEINTERISLFPVGMLDGGGSRDSAYMDGRIMESGGRHGFKGSADSEAQEAALGVLADLTGGRRLTDNARLGEQLGQIAEELSSSYSLGYRPLSPADGKYHQISVKVKRDGAVARYRQGYLASGNRPNVSERTVAAAILGTGTNPLDIGVSCRDQEMREDGTYLVPVAVSVPLGELVLTPEGGRHSARISVLSVVRDKRGGLSEVNERQYPIEIKNEELLSAVEQQATFILGMVLRGGEYRIAVSVRDDSSWVESTVFVDVVVGGASGSSTG